MHPHRPDVACPWEIIVCAFRFQAKIPYTDSGNICIAVNPYQWLPIYGDDVALKYLTALPTEVPPHVFTIASQAFRAMKTTGVSQSVLVSGESGAGKTGAAVGCGRG